MPPAYLSRSTLAAELDCAESTVDEMAKRGVLPLPSDCPPDAFAGAGAILKTH